MARGGATDEQWAEARRAVEAGSSFRGAERASGIGYQRIRRRAQEEGWQQGEVRSDATPEERRAKTAAASAAAAERHRSRLEKIADRMMGDIERLLDEVWAPHAVKEAKVVPQGGGASDVQLVTIPLDEPSPADKKALVTSAAILVDKVQLLTGGATARTETGPIADRAAAEARVRQIRDELEERRRARGA